MDTKKIISEIRSVEELIAHYQQLFITDSTDFDKYHILNETIRLLSGLKKVLNRKLIDDICAKVQSGEYEFELTETGFNLNKTM